MNVNENAIAIIGVDLNFPGCHNIDEFWNNLVNSVECIKDAPIPTREIEQGVKDQNYVNRISVCEDYDKFDAEFFGYSKHEAKVMDPQHRLFLQSCWKALEDAGYKVSDTLGTIGVFGSAGYNTYLVQSILQDTKYLDKQGYYDVLVGNDKDYLATRVSYKLGLRGPSITVQSACSSSLVGVHLACQSLLLGESDLCLAGGVCVRVPCEQGYVHQPGFILAEDGHCKPFDKNGTGTVFGSGVGVVVLKRLEDAINDKDHILSVIRASAMNNDGDRKIGFTAPSYEGQCDVFQTALALEDIDLKSIRYIEAHGTGTVLGDPIELNSIMHSFGLQTQEENQKYPCAIGSVKSNLGHLDAAAGVAGLIKACLCLYHKKLVPTLHFSGLNENVNLDHTRFYIANQVEEIKTLHEPFRAAVNAFGVGGTNVSIILEEPPIDDKKHSVSKKTEYVVALSAKTPNSLHSIIDQVKKVIDKVDIAPFAYTLNTGRNEFNYRAFLICQKQQRDLKMHIKEESSIYSVEENRNCYIDLKMERDGYDGWYELYQSNGIYQCNVDSWLKILMEKQVITEGEFEQTVSFLKKESEIREFVLSIAFLETIREYCKKILCTEVNVTRYLCGELSKEQIWNIRTLKEPKELYNNTTVIDLNEVSITALNTTLGQLWNYGNPVDWEMVFDEEEKRHVPAPTYEFEKTRYWFDENRSLIWHEKTEQLETLSRYNNEDCIFFLQDDKEQTEVAEFVQASNNHVVYDVKFLQSNKPLHISLETLCVENGLLDRKSIHLVFFLNSDAIDEVQVVFYKIISLIRYMNENAKQQNEMFVTLVQIQGNKEQQYAISRLLDGIVNTLPKEVSNLRAKQILCDGLSKEGIEEVFCSDSPMIVQILGGKRYGISFEQKERAIGKSLLKDSGTYVITGGTGNVGLLFAIEISKRVKANIILISKHYTEADIFAANSENLIQIRRVLQEIRAGESKVEVIQQDVSENTSLKVELERIRKKYGTIDGIIHAAGKVGKACDFMNSITPSLIEEYYNVKVKGALAIYEVIQRIPVDFCIFTSSTVSLLGGIGDSIYSGTNAILNELARPISTKQGAMFSVIMDYMPRVIDDESVLKEDGKVRNLLADQLSRDDFSKACDDIFTNCDGENLILTKTKFYERYQKEEEARAILENDSKVAEENYDSKDQVQLDVQRIWNQILESDCKENRNFFDMGGDSFLAIKLLSKINQFFSLKLPIQFIYEYPSIELMANEIYAQLLGHAAKTEYDLKQSAKGGKEEVLVIGMAGRFPGADSVDELWDNLMSKKNCISKFDKDEQPNLLNAKEDNKVNHYVGARGIINDVDKFDYQFFGISKLEAQLMDPQQRIFIQTVWKALEDSGCINLLDEAKVGVFASQGISTYLMNVLLKNNKIEEDYNNVAVINNSPDALATRVSYLLNLTGVSKTVQTFCSSSLVALEEATAYIERGEGDIAIVGGVNIVVPQQSGYIYNESAIYSSTGEVKPFDDTANGTVFGNGVGVAVLARKSFVHEKQLHAYAQILGIGINNDGSQKASFLSPSVKGQMECIHMACQKAEIDLSQLSYIEAHGTATNVGDPIEVHAINRVYTENSKKKGHCAIGSIKGNVGHLDRAAGITSFIKACLVAEKHEIPPVTGFTQLNHQIDLKESGLYINTEPVVLEKSKDIFVGVSALGVGGTNVHVILKSVPATRNRQVCHAKHIVPISTKCEESLIEQKQQFINYLSKQDVQIENMAYTMQLHRKSFHTREAYVAQNDFDFVNQLKRENKSKKINGKINTILFTYDISENALMALLKRLLEEDCYFLSSARSVFSNELKMEIRKEKQVVVFIEPSSVRTIFEFCLKNSLLNLLSEPVIVLFVKKESNIVIDERTIQIQIKEEYDPTVLVPMITQNDLTELYKALAAIWSSGIDVDWKKYNCETSMENIHLPEYEFKKTPCWIQEKDKGDIR